MKPKEPKQTASLRDALPELEAELDASIGRAWAAAKKITRAHGSSRAAESPKPYGKAKARK